MDRVQGNRILWALDNLRAAIVAAMDPPRPLPDERYLSPDLPAGYDTVLGYLAKTNPEALAIMDKEAEATLRDGWMLTAVAKSQGIKPVKVRACQFLEAQGIFEVNAYPVHLLKQRLGV